MIIDGVSCNCVWQFNPSQRAPLQNIRQDVTIKIHPAGDLVMGLQFGDQLKAANKDLHESEAIKVMQKGLSKNFSKPTLS